MMNRGKVRDPLIRLLSDARHGIMLLRSFRVMLTARSILVCMLLASAPARSGAQAASGGELNTVSGVLSLDGRDAVENPRPVRLKGVVLGESTMFPFLTLHDGTRSIGVRLKREHTPVKQGDLVEIQGRTTTINVGGYVHPRVTAEEVVVVGSGDLPQATSVSAAELLSPAAYDQWVSLDGFVTDWRFHAPDLHLQLVTRDGDAEANVTVPDLASLPRNLNGARLRVTGAVVSTPSLGKVLFVPDLKQMEVLEAGTEGVFDAPPASISDVMQRKFEPARRRRVTGVVAALGGDDKIIITGDDEAMTCLLLPDSGPAQPDVLRADVGARSAVSPGDKVELVGSISDSSDAAMRGCGFVHCKVRVTGRTSPPESRTVDLPTLLNWRNHDEWVSVEGVVTAWMLQDAAMSFFVLGPQAGAIVHVSGWPSASFPEDLHGAKVRFTGVSRSLPASSTDALLVPGPNFFEIIKPGVKDPFAVPEASIRVIAAGTPASAGRVKVRGVVVGRSDDAAVYLRGAGAALRVRLQRPWLRPPTAMNGSRYGDCGPWPAFETGDEVEVAGSPVRPVLEPLPEGFDLHECHIRVLRKAGEPRPAVTTLESIAAGAFTSDLVEVRGRLLTLHQVPLDRGEWLTTMLVEAGGVKMPATHLGPGRASFEALKMDDELIVRGLVDPATSRDPRQIWLMAATDVKSLGLSPVVRNRQLWLWSGGAAAVLALLLGWIAVLRRGSRIQAEAAAMLEQRVSERTAELRQTQSDLHRALAQERELGELKTRFVSMVSHEFRTPLGVIMSAVELLQHYSDRLPEDEKKHQLAEIQSSTRHMGGLMEQVLVLGRVEAGKLSCNPRPLDLDSSLGKIVDEVQSSTDRRCPVTVRVDGDLAGSRADEPLMRHILGNLIANAIKYSPSGGEVVLRVRREGNMAVFDVIDQGIGIPDGDRGRLFEAFHRGSNVGETQGTGLGLVIVKRCVELHGGTIDLVTEAGRGTTFTVRLPLFP